MSTITDAERLINLGIEVETKRFGKIVVKELSLEKLILRLNDFAIVIEEMGKIRKSEDTNLTFIANLVAQPAVFNAVKNVVADCCDRKPEEFTSLGLKDWLTIFVAMKKVFDWEELQELFFQLIPREVFKKEETA